MKIAVQKKRVLYYSPAAREAFLPADDNIPFWPLWA